tara:strand:- start:1857 stop:1994 length:138 start_codon:yes stop_codon:yes gene_type:complete
MGNFEADGLAGSATLYGFTPISAQNVGSAPRFQYHFAPLFQFSNI